MIEVPDARMLPIQVVEKVLHRGPITALGGFTHGGGHRLNGAEEHFEQGMLECRAGAEGAECVRHLSLTNRSVEIIMDDADLQHWAEADSTLRTALQSVLAPCIP